MQCQTQLVGYAVASINYFTFVPTEGEEGL